MKVAQILSVVAFTAVSQPYIELPPQPFKPCNIIGHNMQCCWPEMFGGCRAPPGMFPPRMPIPANYRPPPDYLRATCCEAGKECCPVDRKARLPRFTCCESTHSCNIVDDKGTCIEGHSGNGTTPHDTAQLDFGGQCPHDGSLPLLARPGEPIRCSLNKFIEGAGCSTGTCVRDLTDNVNSGVCCKASGCEAHTDCASCVKNTGKISAPCGWLSQGSLANPAPRCVTDCRNFPDKSCVLPSDGRLCPKSDANPNGTVVNTGTCDRRCGLVGTGRSSRINNNGNIPVHNSSLTPTGCCTKYPGDYCCDSYGQRAAHCGYGQNPGQGSLCGVPLRGTPNTLYNSPSPYGPSPNPYLPGVPGYVGHMPYGPRPSPYGPSPYGFVPRPYMGWREADNNDRTAENKQFYFEPPPMYARPLPPQTIVDQPASPHICSCDTKCTELNDCCEDFAKFCVVADATTV